MYTIEEALRIAVDHEKAGRFPVASQIFKSILSVDAANGTATEHLGSIESRWTVLYRALQAAFPGEDVPAALIASLPQLFRMERDLPASHKRPTFLASINDEPGRPNDRLLDLVMGALPLARTARFDRLDARQSAEDRWYRLWPGEHYALIAGIFQVLKPKIAVEIGTFTGMASVAMSENLPADGRLYTFDVVPWNRIQNSWLSEDDFAGNITQIIADISQKAKFDEHRDIIGNADFILIDGPKDHHTEAGIIRHLESIEFSSKPIVMFDDTKFLNMVDLWRGIARPKLDVTSFGHWCGTGLVDWCG